MYSLILLLYFYKLITSPLQWGGGGSYMYSKIPFCPLSEGNLETMAKNLRWSKLAVKVSAERGKGLTPLN